MNNISILKEHKHQIGEMLNYGNIKFNAKTFDLHLRVTSPERRLFIRNIMNNIITMLEEDGYKLYDKSKYK